MTTEHVTDVELFDEAETPDPPSDEPTPEQHRRREYTRHMREMADWLDEHPDAVPGPWSGLMASAPCSSLEDLQAMIRYFGTAEKVDSDYFSGVKVRFGPHHVQAVISKELTCEKVETGDVVTRVVEAAPGTPLPSGARNVRTRTVVEYDVDEAETRWVCPPSLLALGSEEVEAAPVVDDEPF